MLKKLVIAGFLFFCLITTLYAWTNCPPADLSPNPMPIVVGQEKCLIKADWVNLSLNESWSRRVQLVAGKSYWFSATKCARGYRLAGQVKDDRGKVIKSASGSRIEFCFKAPTSGSYVVSYTVTELNGSYTFAITQACLSESNCTR